MAYKQKGFPMHSTRSALKQTSSGEWVPDPNDKSLEMNTVTGEKRKVFTQTTTPTEVSPDVQDQINALRLKIKNAEPFSDEQMALEAQLKALRNPK